MYARASTLLSLLLSICVLWLAHVQVLTFVFLALPLAFMILTLIVRGLPYIIPPTLERRDSGSIITLNLSDKDGD
jgi:cytochrome bd-type quinol oxidase subunit 2